MSPGNRRSESARLTLSALSEGSFVLMHSMRITEQEVLTAAGMLSTQPSFKIPILKRVAVSTTNLHSVSISVTHLRSSIILVLYLPPPNLLLLHFSTKSRRQQPVFSIRLRILKCSLVVLTCRMQFTPRLKESVQICFVLQMFDA